MPTIKIYSKEQVDALIAGAGGLPDPTSASAGDVLTLDSNKDPAWAEPDPGLPDTTSASAGDILTLDANKDPAWVAPSGGNDGWESVDLTNFPSDWVAGERVKVETGLQMSPVSTITNWTTAPSNPNINAFGEKKGIFEYYLSDESGAQSQPIFITRGTAYVGILSLGLYGKPVQFNGGTTAGEKLFSVAGIIFNGAGNTYGTLDITRSNVVTYINRMWRKRPTA